MFGMKSKGPTNRKSKFATVGEPDSDDVYGIQKQARPKRDNAASNANLKLTSGSAPRIPATSNATANGMRRQKAPVRDSVGKVQTNYSVQPHSPGAAGAANGMKRQNPPMRDQIQAPHILRSAKKSGRAKKGAALVLMGGKLPTPVQAVMSQKIKGDPTAARPGLRKAVTVGKSLPRVR